MWKWSCLAFQEIPRGAIAPSCHPVPTPSIRSGRRSPLSLRRWGGAHGRQGLGPAPPSWSLLVKEKIHKGSSLNLLLSPPLTYALLSFKSSKTKFTEIYLVGRFCVCAQVCMLVHVRIRGRNVHSQTRVQGPKESWGSFAHTGYLLTKLPRAVCSRPPSPRPHIQLSAPCGPAMT